MLFRVILLGMFFLPFTSNGQSYSFTKKLDFQPITANVSDTFYLSNVVEYGESFSFSIYLETDESRTSEPTVSLAFEDKIYDMAPTCETHSTEKIWTSRMVVLKNELLTPVLITFNNLPANGSHINIKYNVFVFDDEDNTLKSSRLMERNDCPCPIPSYVPRSAWGASFQLDNTIYRPPATITDVSHLIVHHSATSNSSNNWPGVVASIFNYHANTNQWQDIGYNWLIDPNGTLYQGRGGGQEVRGAHMCGYNDYTSGICMLGTFTDTDPSPQALITLDSLLAYYACLKNFEPSGSADIPSYTGHMFRISGHRDGCSPNYTECPGARLHAFLPTTRNNTQTYLEEECQTVSSEDFYEIKPYSFAFYSGYLNISSTMPGLFSLWTLSGSLIWEDYLSEGQSHINFQLPAGVYVLKASIDKKLFSEKIVGF